MLHFVVRNRGKLNEREQWFYNGIRIEVVNTFNNLGLLFYHNGNLQSLRNLLPTRAVKLCLQWRNHVEALA